MKEAWLSALRRPPDSHINLQVTHMSHCTHIMIHGKLFKHRDTEKFNGHRIMYFAMKCKQGVTSLMYSLWWVGSGRVPDPSSDEYSGLSAQWLLFFYFRIGCVIRKVAWWLNLIDVIFFTYTYTHSFHPNTSMTPLNKTMQYNHRRPGVPETKILELNNVLITKYILLCEQVGETSGS